MSLNSVQSFVIENCNGPTIENGLNNVCLHPLSRTFTNKLSLNYAKTQYMMVSKRNNNVNNFRIHVNDIEIERVKKYKYLGVWLDDELSWKNHIQSLSSTLSKIAGVIYKIRNDVNFYCLKTYYNLIQSKLIYGILAWGTTNNQNLKQHKQSKVLSKEQG